MRTSVNRSGLLLWVLGCVAGCSSSDKQTDDAATVPPGGEGGAASTGGVLGSGGVVGSGGAIGVGGKPGSGGATGVGGKPSSGGATGAGGKPGSGGVAGKGSGGAIVVATGGISTGGAIGVDGGASACIGKELLAALGKDTVLVGASMEDATAAKAPFDGRYLYLSGGFFDGSAPCTSCASGCTAAGVDCSNAVGCGWWGCWQWDQDPPGQYVVDFVGKNEKASPKQIPMLTYYEELQGSGLNEGATQVKGLDDATFLVRYFADWRLVLQRIGSHPALLHIEPDFWGYVEQSNADPHAVPAKVTTANPTDCAGYENSAVGFTKCLIHMVRVYAPSAKVGVHASAWGTNFDVFGNRDGKLDVPGEAKKMATFLTALGAKDGDFIVSDPSDRDAGFYQAQKPSRDTWWDDTNAKLPNFHQAFTWTKTLAETMGMPIIFWQIPVGNMKLDNTKNHYKDNRVDYFFAHMDEVAAAHIVGLFFGAGNGETTTPETDGGNLVSKVSAYRTAGGTKVCP
jgi:hypothetical protein